MEAAYYSVTENKTVRCELCPNGCVIPEGKSGACRIRTNHGGKLLADGYANLVSHVLDPVEKKPLYHFHPGKQILSTGPNGCSFHCGFCQNSAISQRHARVTSVSPEELAELGGQNGSIGVAYTYSEPLVWFEYVRDTARLVHERGLVNVLVTNGYVNEAPLRELLPFIDAMNIDLKSMRPDFYRDVCGGKLDDVLRTIEIASASCHVELTNLIIPGYNDTIEDFIKIIEWVGALNPKIPLHFSRYFPRYRFTAPETPEETLCLAYAIGKKNLKYVYMGNVSYTGVSDTECAMCGNTLITRDFSTVRNKGIRKGVCALCGTRADVIGLSA